jgi:tetraacyldisaccharide 4'-kinase
MIKKPKFWDNNSLSFLSIILLPFTIFLRINNFFLNFNSKTKRKEIFSICVGNIYVGGTGKTPTTIKLFQILRKINRSTVTAKKFYKAHNDEAKLLNKKTNFITGLNRLEIINKAVNKKKEIIIFDDGLQDRGVEYNLKFACFNGSNWIGNGHLIPSGPLRENLSSLKKFDAVFLKDIKNSNRKISSIIKKINPKIKIFYSKYKINNLKNFNLSKKYVVFSGIGNHESFKVLLKMNKFNIIKYLSYPDHYEYKKYEIIKIIQDAKKLNAKILTTEKDFTKIPKEYHKKIKFLSVDLIIENKKNLIKLLKLKINE